MSLRKKASQIGITMIRIEPYLAEYAQNLFGLGRKDGSIKIPYISELHFLVWELMAKPRANQLSPENGNLAIVLPTRRECEGELRKNPRYYNYLSPDAARKVEAWLRRRFNFEFHELMIDNEVKGRPRQHLDLVRWFMRRRGLKSITEDALIRNFRRYRRRISPKTVRKYTKTRKIKNN